MTASLARALRAEAITQPRLDLMIGGLVEFDAMAPVDGLITGNKVGDLVEVVRPRWWRLDRWWRWVFARERVARGSGALRVEYRARLVRRAPLRIVRS